MRDSVEAERRANLLLASEEPLSPGPVRFDRSSGEDPKRYWSDIPDANKQPLVIVSGMSQMYAINDPQPRDEIIVEHVDDALAPGGVRAFGLAAPNMNNEEALLYLLAAALDARTKPTTFVYGVCFDKFRNVDLRPGMAHFLDQLPGLRDAWSRVCASHTTKYPMACAKVASTPEPNRSRVSTAHEEDTEQRLRTALGRLVPMIDQSAALNGKFQRALFDFRNWLFRIKSSTKRPMLDSVYHLNQQFLELLADVAREHQVTLVLYVIPLNPIADNPYIPEQYAAFKSWLGRFASERGLPFANFENVVPPEDWGFTNGETDFKHFRERGHELTAAAIVDRFGPVLRARSLPERPSAATP